MISVARNTFLLVLIDQMLSQWGKIPWLPSWYLQRQSFCQIGVPGVVWSYQDMQFVSKHFQDFTKQGLLACNFFPPDTHKAMGKVKQ